MIKLISIKKEELPYYVGIAFHGDDKLCNQYHISPGTPEHCINNTLEFIEENVGFYKNDAKFFKIVNGETPIGYTIILKNDPTINELYSFGIQKRSRTEEVKQAWLQELGKVLGKNYYIVLWSKNTRAVNFFEKNGFKVDRQSKLLNDETKTLITCLQED